MKLKFCTVCIFLIQLAAVTVIEMYEYSK